MTVINSWWHEENGTPGGGELRAFLQCDGCLPPHMNHGSAARFHRMGWRFDRLEEGPHYCSWCRSRRRRGRRRRLFLPVERPSLPNLVTIGAPKCGTTSMHHYLSLHPEIHASRAKEVNFFQDPDCLDKLSLYATFFDDGAPVRTESSTVYAWYPLVQGVPERIRTALPDAKLIYLVRDPVERTVSHHVQRSSARTSTDDFDTVVDQIEDPYNPFIAASKYAKQLEQYTRHFPIERILVIDQAELLQRRDETLRRVFRFAGVDEDFTSPEFAGRSNTRAGKRVKTSAYRALSRATPTARLRRRLPAHTRRALFAPIKRLTTTEVEAPELTDEVRRRLRDTFRADVDRLRAITGQEFATWQI